MQVAHPEEPPLVLDGFGGEVTGVAWCRADMGEIATCSDDASVRLWKLDREAQPRHPCRRKQQVPYTRFKQRTQSPSHMVEYIAARTTSLHRESAFHLPLLSDLFGSPNLDPENAWNDFLGGNSFCFVFEDQSLQCCIHMGLPCAAGGY